MKTVISIVVGFMMIGATLAQEKTPSLTESEKLEIRALQTDFLQKQVDAQTAEKQAEEYVKNAQKQLQDSSMVFASKIGTILKNHNLNTNEYTVCSGPSRGSVADDPCKDAPATDLVIRKLIVKEEKKQVTPKKVEQPNTDKEKSSEDHK